MYHYIHKDSDHKIFKNLKGISTETFEQHIKYLLKNFTPVKHKDIIDFFLYDKPLSKNAFYLTFDDGFKQHITNVVPILNKYSLEASFYMPTMPIKEKKLHFLEKQRVIQYSSYKNYREFLEELYITAKDFIEPEKLKYFKYNNLNLERTRNYLKQYSFYNNSERLYRYFRDEILTKDEITNLINIMFEKNYKEDEFIQNYYLDLNDIKKIRENHIVGGHSHTHPFLDKISKQELENELDKSIEILGAINSYSYPYGTYNENVKKQLESRNIVYAFTTNDTTSSLTDRYAINRIDASNFDKIKELHD